MNCPKCNNRMNPGYADLLRYGLSKPIWSCVDFKKCGYTMDRKMKEEK